MKKNAIISVIIFFLLCALVYGIYTLASNVKEDQELTSEKMNEILKSYDSFSTSIENFSKLRDKYYKEKENTYLEEFAKNVNGWNDLMSNYELSIKEIEKSSKILKENCIVKFADPNINSKCSTFKSTYEGAMNYYISDINTYNEMVIQYNQWVTNGSYNYGKLNKVNLPIYKNYIDYDNDGEYFGKEESISE